MRTINFELGLAPSMAAESKVEGGHWHRHLRATFNHFFFHLHLPFSSGARLQQDAVSPLRTQYPLTFHKTYHAPRVRTSISPSSGGKLSATTVCLRHSTVSGSNDANLSILRSMSLLSRSPMRPSLPPQRSTTSSLSSETVTSSSFFPLSQPTTQQIRGAKPRYVQPKSCDTETKARISL